MLDAGIVGFNILEFKFTGAPPWTIPLVHICLFLLKLVKASHFPSELQSSAFEHAQLHTCLFPSILMGPNLVRVWSGPLFFLTLMYSSLPVVALIFTPELCAIFLTLVFCSTTVIVLSFILIPEMSCRPLGGTFIDAIP